ncbi:MAG: hypothetical protein ACIAQF_13685 [Phycisphaerales bacterium JB065]
MPHPTASLLTAGVLCFAPGAIAQSVETTLDHDSAERMTETTAADLSLNIDRAASWKARATASLWFPSLNGNQTLRGGTEFNIDIIDQPDVQLAPRFELAFRRERWTILTSGFVFNIDQTATVTGGSFISGGTTISPGDRVSYDIDYWSADLLAAYRIKEIQIDNHGKGPAPNPYSVPSDGVGLFFDITGGARVWHLDYSMNEIGGGSLIDITETWVDPIIGARMTMDLPHGLGLEVRGDVGGFGVGSDFAWNIEAAFKAQLADNIGAEIGFRHLQTSYDAGSGLDEIDWSIATAGLYGSIVIRF